MTGLLSYAVGGLAGAAKGVGDAMMLKAKQDREDMLIALEQANKEKLQGNEFQHQDTEQQAGFAHADTAQKSQQDFQSGQTDKEIAAHHADVQTQEKGASARSAAEIAGRHQDVATQTQAQITSANIRAGWENNRVNAYAARLSQGKPLTYAQALQAARQAYTENRLNNTSPTDDNGNAIPADTWISAQAARLMAQQPGNSTPFITQTNGNAIQFSGAPGYSGFGGAQGGGLLNPAGTSTVTPQLFSAPSPSPNPPPAPGQQGSYSDAVRLLQSDPKTYAPLFDQRYGQGVAATELQGSTPQVNAPDFSKATATATNAAGQKIYQVGNQWLDVTGKPVQ